MPLDAPSVDRAAPATRVWGAAGATSSAALGAVLVGEHMRTAPAGSGYWEEASSLSLAQCEDWLGALRAAGVASIVDTTTIEAGRDLRLASEASRNAGVTVICSSGLAAAGDGVSPAFRSLTSPRLADVYIAELTGTGPSGIRTAALTVAFAEASDVFDDVALLAVAFAHAETGAPVLLDAPAAQVAARISALLAHGIDPERILALGLDAPDTTWRIIDEVATHGVHLGFSSIGDGRIDDAARAAAVSYAVRRYGPHRMWLGTGAAGVSLRVPGAALPDEGLAAPARIAAFTAQLEAYGVSSGDIGNILTTGAGALFSIPADVADG